MNVLTSQMQALLAYANETTGMADVRLGDAVRTLADGYGQGGESDEAGYRYRDEIPHVVNGRWVCPDDWDNPEGVDRSGEVLYLVYDVSGNLPYCSFNPLNAKYKVTQGHFVNKAFVATSATESFAAGAKYQRILQKDSSGKNTIVLKVEPDGSTFSSFQFQAYTYNGVSLNVNDQPVVIRYGRLPNLTSMLGRFTFLEVCDLAGVKISNLQVAYQNMKYLKKWRRTDWQQTFTNASSMFMGCEFLVDMDDLTNFIGTRTTTIGGMFNGMTRLRKLNITGWNTSSITDFSQLFDGCYNLKEIIGIESLNATKVTSMRYMFRYCQSLVGKIDISGWNIVGLTNTQAVNNMFLDCWNIAEIDISNINLSNVADISAWFSGCYSLSKITAKGITPPSAGKLNNLNAVFGNCYNLKEIDCDGDGFFGGWNFSACSYYYNTFSGCYNLVGKAFGTPAVGFSGTDSSSNRLNNAFQNCKCLTAIDLSWMDMTKWTASNDSGSTTMLTSCYELVDFYPPQNIRWNISVASSTKLSRESVLRIINNLIAPKGTTTSTKTLSLGVNKAKLTAEEIAIATNLGWTVA